MVPYCWPCCFYSSGFGVVPVVVFWLGVGVRRRARHWGAALVWRHVWRHGTPLVFVFARCWGAASGTSLGIGVGVRFGVVVHNRV